MSGLDGFLEELLDDPFLVSVKYRMEHMEHTDERALRIPIIADASMPPGYFEIRSGNQRVGAWLPEAREEHDPGDEDRSER